MKVYELTEEEFKELMNAAKPVPYMIVGGRAPSSPYEMSKAIWYRVAQRVNCDVETIEGVDRNKPLIFRAEPLD